MPPNRSDSVLASWDDQFGTREPGSNIGLENQTCVVEAVCQALMYVLCYRVEQIAERGPATMSVLRNLPLDR